MTAARLQRRGRGVKAARMRRLPWTTKSTDFLRLDNSTAMYYHCMSCYANTCLATVDVGVHRKLKGSFSDLYCAVSICCGFHSQKLIPDFSFFISVCSVCSVTATPKAQANGDMWLVFTFVVSQETNPCLCSQLLISSEVWFHLRNKWIKWLNAYLGLCCKISISMKTFAFRV